MYAKLFNAQEIRELIAKLRKRSHIIHCISRGKNSGIYYRMQAKVTFLDEQADRLQQTLTYFKKNNIL